MLKKVILVFIVTMFVFYFFNYKVYAKEIFELGKEWLDLGAEENNFDVEWYESRPTWLTFANSFDELEDFAGVFFGGGVFVIVISGMIIGAKFMLASPEKKADLKKVLWIYLLGSVIILGALGIWRVSIDFLENLV